MKEGYKVTIDNVEDGECVSANMLYMTVRNPAIVIAHMFSNSCTPCVVYLKWLIEEACDNCELGVNQHDIEAESAQECIELLQKAFGITDAQGVG